MKSAFRILIAITVVCALVVGRRGPQVLASSIVAAGNTDRDALVALYQATKGANWLNSKNWLSDAPIGDWYGVTTDDSGRVIELNLSHNQLSGTIPSKLGNLTNLVWLNLSHSELSGTIPSELGNLTNLEGLALSHNQLSGTIPSELSSLTNLEWLDLRGNQLSGTIPSELGKLAHLEWLDLRGNQLSGLIPSELGNLTNLEGLYLSDNRFSGCVPDVWRNAEDNDLDRFGLPFCVAPSPTLTATDRDVLVALYQAVNGANWANSKNWLSDAPIGDWYGVTTDDRGRVIELSLSYNELSGTIPSELGNLTNLVWLNLSHNELSGTIPSEVGNLTNLEGLALSKNQLSGTIPAELGNPTHLEWLDLRGNQLSGTIPSELGNPTHLEGLYLSDNQLSGCVPEVWRNAEDNDLDRLGLPFCVAPSPTLTATDREALVVFYQATNGANWLNRANWLTDAPIDAWHGVTTDDSGRVIGLDLSENGLRGTIPSELGNLTDLQELYLYSNQLSGAIPPELGKLTNLEGLALSENQLRGTIPSELGNLTRLQTLRLWDNELSGTIPSELGKLTSLTRLYLSDNQLSGTIPSELGKLTNVEGLYLYSNQLSGSIPSALGKLTSLEELYLWGNQLSGTIPSELRKLTNLTVLALSGNELSGTIPSELGNLTNLEGLDLWDNQLSGTIPSELGKLTKLIEMGLDSNQLSGSIPSELGKLTSLEKLYLSGNQLSGCVPEVWRNVEENDLDKVSLPFCTDRDVLVALYQATEGVNWLKSDNWLTDAPIDTWHGVTTDDSGRVIDLDLRENGLSGTIPSELGNLTNLELLYLGGNELSGTIPPELGNLTNLELLYLGGNELSGTIPPELGKLTNLTGLSLTSNELSGTIPPELGNLTNLELLYLGGNELSGTIPPELGKLTNLGELQLWGNELSGTIPPELGNLANLTELALSENGLRGTIPSELGKLINLTWLFLWSNELSGTIPTELGNLTSLTRLYLSGNRLNGCVPQVWRNVEENDLESLGLRFCVAPSPTPTAVTETLTPAQIFRKVSPAIAFIQTATSTGSGVLVAGGYLVTNAHVVWPFDAARVVFPDGTAFNGVPVKGWDLLADLAVLGPIDAPAQPVTLLDGENVPIGSDMYLIGYPGEFEAFPQPTFVWGILSRLREWEPVGITYFQTATTIVGGQSGGALVSETGDVIGISGFRILEGKFGFVASAADLLPRIRQLIAGEDPAGLGERRLPLEGGALRHELTSQSYGDAYIINEPAGAAIEIELSGAHGARVRVFDPFGGELTDAETDSLSFVTERNGPHFLILSQVPEEFTLTANRRLARFDDPDRGRQIQVGQSLHGNIDFPADIDFFLLHLEQNETVEIVAQSALADTHLVIWEATAEEWIEDDNSGGGLFGLDSRIVYRAPRTGEYVLFVADAGWSAPGGYVISVDRAQATDRPTAQVPTVTINTHINVREGPGVNYPIISAAAPGEAYVITGKNPGLGNWWEIDYKGRPGWVYGPLVTATNVQSVQAVATPDPP